MTTRNPSGPEGGTPELGSPELIVRPGGDGPRAGGGLEHLVAHRRLIVRRSLLATAVGGVIPLPVMDEYVAGRVKAGLLLKLAERRQVDLAQSSADLLGDPREGTAVSHGTLTVITLVALKKAWGKVFAILALGRRAEEMATTFQLGTLFDHFCAKLHVGPGIDRNRAIMLRAVIHASLAETERGALVAAFNDGSRILGRTVLEAPAWAGDQLERASRRWAESGGTTTEGAAAAPGDDKATDPDDAGAGTEARWLDRAALAVERRLSVLGQGYLTTLVSTFERRWHEAEAAARQKAEAASAGGPGSGSQS
jgi:hypothetical protein